MYELIIQKMEIDYDKRYILSLSLYIYELYIVYIHITWTFPDLFEAVFGYIIYIYILHGLFRDLFEAVFGYILIFVHKYTKAKERENESQGKILNSIFSSKKENCSRYDT